MITELPKEMPADPQSQCDIYRDYAAGVKTELDTLKSKYEQLRLSYNSTVDKMNSYKMKWEIECERFNDLMEKIVDKVGR